MTRQHRSRGASLRGSLSIVYFLCVTLLALIAFPSFRSPNTLMNILRQAVIPMISCVALNFILTTGNIDLSCGYLVGLVSITIGVLNRAAVPPALIIVAALCIGAAVGLFNGGLMVLFGIPSFIATLGSGYICYGIAQIVAQSKSVRNMQDGLLAFGKMEIFPGFQIMMVYAVLFVVLAHILMNHTTFGRTLTGMGLNARSTMMSGQKTNQTLLFSFAICSILVAFSALLSTIRVNTAQADMGGPSYTFEAVTACVLGGTSLYGGKTNILGGFFAVFVIIELEMIITILGINHYIYQAMLGVIILIAIVVQTAKERRTH